MLTVAWQINRFLEIQPVHPHSPPDLGGWTFTFYLEEKSFQFKSLQVCLEVKCSSCVFHMNLELKLEALLEVSSEIFVYGFPCMRSGKYLRLNANYHTNLCKIFFAQASAYSTFSSPNPSLHFSGFVIVEDNNLNIHKKVVGDDSKSSPSISVQFFFWENPECESDTIAWIAVFRRLNWNGLSQLSETSHFSWVDCLQANWFWFFKKHNSQLNIFIFRL